MSYTLQIVYVSCVGTTIVQCFLLRRVLRYAFWLRGIAGALGESRSTRPLAALPVGSPIPRFRTDIVNSSERFDSGKLKGARSLLLFVSAGDASHGDEQLSDLRLFVQVLSKRLDGRVYVVCSGSSSQCQVVKQELTPSFGEDEDQNGLLVLEDPHGFVARACFVHRTPAAVRIDERGRVEQYGFPLDVVLEELPASIAEELGLVPLSEQLGHD